MDFNDRYLLKVLGGGGGVLPIMAYKGRLRPKGYPFQALEISLVEVYDLSFGSVKGPKGPNTWNLWLYFILSRENVLFLSLIPI